VAPSLLPQGSLASLAHLLLHRRHLLLVLLLTYHVRGRSVGVVVGVVTAVVAAIVAVVVVARSLALVPSPPRLVALPPRLCLTIVVVVHFVVVKNDFVKVVIVVSGIRLPFPLPAAAALVAAPGLLLAAAGAVLGLSAAVLLPL